MSGLSTGDQRQQTGHWQDTSTSLRYLTRSEYVQLPRKLIYIWTKRQKVKFALEQATKAQSASSYSSTLSLTSALDGCGRLTPRPDLFTTGKKTLTWCYDLEKRTLKFFLWQHSPTHAQAALLFRFLDHTQLDTHTVGLLCTSDQLVAEAATCTAHNKHYTKYTHSFVEIRTCSPSIRAAANLQLKRRLTWRTRLRSIDDNTKMTINETYLTPFWM